MSAVTSITRRDVAILLGILLLAGWMRLGRADIVEYFHDDAMLATLALEMVDGERFPLTGILSSTGIPNPPTSVYVIAAPFSLSADPNFAIHFVMLLNVIGVGLLWLIAHRYFGRTVGIIASTIYAVSPWAVLFSRKIWAQDFHTPFILLGIFLLLYGFWESSERHKRQHRIAQIISILVLLFAFQTHFASWAIAPILVVALWQGRKRIIWQTAIASLLLSLLVIAPYVIGLVQTLEQDPTRISDAVGRSGASEELAIDTKPITDSIFLSSGTGLETWVAPEQQAELSATYPLFSQSGLILTVFVIVGLIVVWRRHRQFFLLLVIWGFLPQLVLIPAWTAVYIHYFIPSIPVMLLLAGIGLTSLFDKIMQHRILLTIGWLMFAGMLGSQVITWHTVLDFLESQHIPYPGFTTPIGDLNAIKTSFRDADDVLIISQGMSWNMHHEVAVWDTLLWDDVRCVRTIIGDGYAVFPAHPFNVVIAPDAQANPVDNLYQTDNPIHYETRQNDKGYTIYQWDSSPQWTQSTIQVIDPVVFDNRVQLIGYTLDDENIYLEWRLPAQNKRADYQYSAQFFDVDGNRVAQLDKTFWHGRHWCDDDRLITWGALSADKAVTLKVGMYMLGIGKDKGQFFPANILDELGNPIGQSADIRLISAN